MTDVPKVEQINVPLTPPRDGRLVTFTFGFYVVENDADHDRPGRQAACLRGQTYSQKLDGESPRLIAARFAKTIHFASRSGRMADFNRPLHYPKIGIAEPHGLSSAWDKAGTV